MAQIKIRADVAGTVWKIEVAVGARVAEGDTIMLIESMKMEIPVMAPRSCKLLRVLVREGDPVSEGQVVAEIE